MFPSVHIASGPRPEPLLLASDAVDAIREMFPKCAGCGRVIRAGERVTPCEDRNRVRCEACSAPITPN